MASRTFASLVPKLAPSVTGCPTATIEQYIRDAAIRVCERTLAWRHQVPLFTLAPGVYEYFFNKPAGTDVHGVFGAVVNNSPLEILTLDQAIELYPEWADLYGGMSAEDIWGQSGGPHTFNADPFNDSQFNQDPELSIPVALTGGSTPRSVTQITPDKFVILPMPDAAKPYTMRMFVALKPKRNATGMDEYMFDELEDVIMHGALQHLLVLPNKSWSDRELASYHAKQFVSHIAERRARANLTNARGSLRVRTPQY